MSQWHQARQIAEDEQLPRAGFQARRRRPAIAIERHVIAIDRLVNNHQQRQRCSAFCVTLGARLACSIAMADRSVNMSLTAR